MTTTSASVNAALAHALQLLATQPALAAQQAQEILTSVPGHPGALLVQGLAANAQQDYAQAIAILRPLVQAQPAAIGAWLALADAYFAQGDEDAADAAYLQSVRHSAHSTELMQAADVPVFGPQSSSSSNWLGAQTSGLSCARPSIPGPWLE